MGSDGVSPRIVGDVPIPSLRSTQRAPRSCTRCYRLKIKCDQRIPCQQCIKKGIRESCSRETVLVRGAITTVQADAHVPTYDELLAENIRLKGSARQHVPGDQHTAVFDLDVDHNCDMFERYLYETVQQPIVHSDFDSGCILFPVRDSSKILVDYDKTWNSWVHYAVQYPEFDQEHELFWERFEAGMPDGYAHPSWLALYFAVLAAALLTIDESEIKDISLPLEDTDSLLRVWFDTSLHYLNLSGFLRGDDIRAVQTIAVLGICFNNLGEYKLYKTLWSCAIRIAQGLGMDQPRTADLFNIKPELCRRLWWTLVICEWLSVPWHPPCVADNDFNMPLPDPEFESATIVKGPDGIAPCSPVDYHIFMVRVSSVHYMFRRALRSLESPVADIVRDADDRLAEVIGKLPSHLQPDEPQTSYTKRRDRVYPWIPWQRVYLTLVLLYHRMVINRTLQSSWLVDRDKHGGPRAICLSSAKHILSIQREWTTPLAKRRQWNPTIHTYAAAACLLRDIQIHSFTGATNCQDLLDYSISHLSQLESTSAVAKAAVEVLRQLSTGQSALVAACSQLRGIPSAQGSRPV